MIKSFLAIVLEKLVQIRFNNLTDSYLRTVVSEIPTHRSDALLEFKKQMRYCVLATPASTEIPSIPAVIMV